MKTPIKSNHKSELPTALVVDDNEDFLNFMVESFSDNYCVKIAKDGREAWGMILELMPDVIISDVMMPEMDDLSLNLFGGSEDIVKSEITVNDILYIGLFNEQNSICCQNVESEEKGGNEFLTSVFDWRSHLGT